MTDEPITALAELEQDTLTEGIDIIRIKSPLIVENNLGIIIEQVNQFCDDIESVIATETNAKEYRRARTKFRRMKQSFEDEVTAVRTEITAGLIDFEADAKTIKKRLEECDNAMRTNLENLKKPILETSQDTSQADLSGVKLYKVSYTATGTMEQIKALKTFMERNNITYEDLN